MVTRYQRAYLAITIGSSLRAALFMCAQAPSDSLDYLPSNRGQSFCLWDLSTASTETCLNFVIKTVSVGHCQTQNWTISRPMFVMLHSLTNEIISEESSIRQWTRLQPWYPNERARLYARSWEELMDNNDSFAKTPYPITYKLFHPRLYTESANSR